MNTEETEATEKMETTEKTGKTGTGGKRRTRAAAALCAALALVCALSACKGGSDDDDTPAENQGTSTGTPSVSAVVSDPYFWGTWTRMDSGTDYVIGESRITSGDGSYAVTSADSASVTSVLGTFRKESDSVMKWGNIPFFRKGGSNIAYKATVVGFTGSAARAAVSSGPHGISATATGTADAYPSYTESAETDGDGVLTLHSPVSGTANTVTVTTDSGVTVTVEVSPTNSGENVGTVAVVGENQYSLKVSGIITTDTSGDGGYLYAGKTYDMTVSIKNVSPSGESRPGTYTLSGDSLLTVTGGTTDNLPTVKPSASTETRISVTCGALSEAYLDTAVRFEWKDADGNVWEDSIPLRFFRGNFPVGISAYSMAYGKGDTAEDIALNGFFMYPDGNSLFFSVPHGSSRVVILPSFPSGEPYKLAFSGATASGELYDNTEMIYAVGINRGVPVVTSADDTGMKFTDLVNQYERNDTEDSAASVSGDEIAYAYLEDSDIDYYSFSGDYGTTHLSAEDYGELSLDRTALSLECGTGADSAVKSAALTAHVWPSGASVTWTSSAPSVCTVSQNGVVTAAGAGTAVVTARITQGSAAITAVCAVTVTSVIAAEGVSVSAGTLSLVYGAGAEAAAGTLSAAVSPSDATNQNVTWTSSDTSVCTVDQYGVVTAVGLGDAAVTVTTADGGYTAACAVSVNGVTLDRTALFLEWGTGADSAVKSAALTAHVWPSGASVTWTSSDTSVCTVDQYGVVTAAGAGAAAVTARITAGGATITAACAVTVTAAGVSAVVSEELSEHFDSLEIDGATATATMTDGGAYSFAWYLDGGRVDSAETTSGGRAVSTAQLGSLTAGMTYSLFVTATGSGGAVYSASARFTYTED